MDDRINEIADRTARIEGKLDQYLVDQGRTCAAHHQATDKLNDRVKAVEDDVARVKDNSVTKAFVAWAMGILVTLSGIVYRMLEVLGASASPGGK